MEISKAHRTATFSSSNVWKLMTEPRSKSAEWSDRAMTYINEVRNERRMGRPINVETDARQTSWGKICEKRVFELLPIHYKAGFIERFHHPILPWSGAPDVTHGTTVGDVKSPYNLGKFCDKIDALRAGLEEYKKEFPEDYWQHVSNSCLLSINDIPTHSFEAIIYCPYAEEMDEIRQMVMAMEDDQRDEFKWILYAKDKALPWIRKGFEFENLNVFRFAIPMADKQALTEKITKATEML